MTELTNNDMRLHRFYSKEKLPEIGEVTISDWEVLRQWFNVFKFKQRHKVVLFDGSDNTERVCEIISILDPKNVIVRIEETKIRQSVSQPSVVLFQSLLKKGNLDFVVEKATEIGVAGIVPVLSDRSEKKGINEERLKKILIEASEQSGRCMLPTLSPIVSFVDVFEKHAMPKILFHPEGKPFSREALETLTGTTPELGILIGPEGGFSEREIEMCNARNIPVFSLGTQILRAETAAIAALSLVLLS